MEPQRISVLLLLLALLGSSTALAADTNHPIEITADPAMREEPSGKTTYRGDVVLTQGSLEIRADRLVFGFDADDTTLITATGNPATLRQQPENADTPVDASATTIEYHEKAERVRPNPNRMRKSAKALNGLFYRKISQAREATTKIPRAG